MTSIAITIPPEAWEETGSEDMPWSRLMVSESVTINGHFFHCEAYAVVEDGKLGQVAVDPVFGDDFDHYLCATGCALTTQQIRGREYAIIITPHGA